MQKYVFPFNKLKLHIDKLSKLITKIKMCNHFFTFTYHIYNTNSTFGFYFLYFCRKFSYLVLS